MALPITKPDQQEITYEEYLALPETMQRYEILDGVIIMSPSPTDEHQWELAELYDHLKEFVRANNLGVVLFAPLDIIITKTPKLRTRRPDLVFYGSAKVGTPATRKGLKEAREKGVPPDLAVEILSPEEERRELTSKLADYAAIGVQEVWIISPQAETVEVLRLEEGQYVRAGLYGCGDTVYSHCLAGFRLLVDEVFE